MPALQVLTGNLTTPVPGVLKLQKILDPISLKFPLTKTQLRTE